MDLCPRANHFCAQYVLKQSELGFTFKETPSFKRFLCIVNCTPTILITKRLDVPIIELSMLGELIVIRFQQFGPTLNATFWLGFV